MSLSDTSQIWRESRSHSHTVTVEAEGCMTYVRGQTKLLLDPDGLQTIHGRGSQTNTFHYFSMCIRIRGQNGTEVTGVVYRFYRLILDGQGCRRLAASLILNLGLCPGNPWTKLGAVSSMLWRASQSFGFTVYMQRCIIRVVQIRELVNTYGESNWTRDVTHDEVHGSTE